MPEEKRFITLGEVKPIIEALKDKYPDKFYAVNPDTIVSIAVENKPRPNSKKEEITIKGIKPPTSLLTSKEYILFLYLSDWETWTEGQRIIHVARTIYRISDEGGGKLVKPNIEDNSVFLNTFGLGYEDKEDVPNILEKEIEWKDCFGTSEEESDDDQPAGDDFEDNDFVEEDSTTEEEDGS